MTKKIKKIPDSVYQEQAEHLGKVKAEKQLLNAMGNLLESREEEATFIEGSASFMAGYRMAFSDIMSSVLNKVTEETETKEEPPKSEEVPF